MSSPNAPILVNCLVSSDAPSAIFTIETSPGDQISILKQDIGTQSGFDIPSRFITLFKVSHAPEDPLLLALNPRTIPGAEELSSPLKLVSNFFTDTLAHEVVDLLVVPPLAASLVTSKSVPPADKTVDEKAFRTAVEDTRVADAPSTIATSISKFQNEQEKRPTYNGRPGTRIGPPITIYNRAFAIIRDRLKDLSKEHLTPDLVLDTTSSSQA